MQQIRPADFKASETKSTGLKTLRQRHSLK